MEREPDISRSPLNTAGACILNFLWAYVINNKEIKYAG
jgi:hypothetical protein